MLDVTAKWVGLDEGFDELEADLSKVVRGISVEIFDRILAQTPQYDGRLVASWTYTLNSPLIVDRSGEVATIGDQNRRPDGGLSKGSPTAINIAKLFNLGNDAKFKLGDTVWMSNGADHGEGPYASDAENGAFFLRGPNRPGAMVSRAFDYAEAKYGAGVTMARAQFLKSNMIGI